MVVARQRDSWGLVLAGGDGVRLQALTRALTGVPIPKQYCRLAGNRSMLEATLARIRPLFRPSRTLTLVNRDHLPLAEDQVRTLPASNLLVQPQNRDTGPGLLFGLLGLRRRDPSGMVAVFPSDHYVRRARAFRSHVTRAFEVARRFPEKIVLLGIAPDRVEPGLGYLEVGGPLSHSGHQNVFHVASFIEKPDPGTAERIIGRGGLWNSFVMVFHVKTMISLLRRYRPSDYKVLSRLGKAAYASLSPWNFSRDFLAHIPEELLVLQVGEIGWSDWGTREAVERTFHSLDLVPPWQPAACANEAAA